MWTLILWVLIKLIDYPKYFISSVQFITFASLYRTHTYIWLIIYWRHNIKLVKHSFIETIFVFTVSLGVLSSSAVTLSAVGSIPRRIISVTLYPLIWWSLPRHMPCLLLLVMYFKRQKKNCAIKSRHYNCYFGCTYFTAFHHLHNAFRLNSADQQNNSYVEILFHC